MSISNYRDRINKAIEELTVARELEDDPARAATWLQNAVYHAGLAWNDAKTQATKRPVSRAGSADVSRDAAVRETQPWPGSTAPDTKPSVR